MCVLRKNQPSNNNGAFESLIGAWGKGDSVVGGAAAQHHQPGSMFIGLGAQRGTVATTRSESSRKGSGTVWRSLLGAPPLLVVELTEAEPNSSSAGTAGGALTETAGEGGTQSCAGGTQSMSTATDHLSSSPSTMDTIEEGVGHPEIGGGTECAGRAVGGRSGEGLRARQTRGSLGC